MYSLALTFRSVVTGDFNKVEPQRLKQAKLALHDLLVALMSLMISSFLMSDKKKSKNDPEKLDQYSKLGIKILQRATGEFDPFSNFASPFAEPSFIIK